jgi:hypothetical protein
MACSLTSGRKVPCKSAVGGIKNIYFADYGTLGAATIVAGEITVLAGTPDWYKFEVKGNSSLETAINSSRENGTTFYESTLTMSLTFQDKATQEQLKLITHARPHVAVEDYNGNFFLVGLEHGAEVNWRFNCYWCCNGRFKWLFFDNRCSRNCTTLFCSSCYNYC